MRLALEPIADEYPNVDDLAVKIWETPNDVNRAKFAKLGTWLKHFGDAGVRMEEADWEKSADGRQRRLDERSAQRRAGR